MNWWSEKIRPGRGSNPQPRDSKTGGLPPNQPGNNFLLNKLDIAKIDAHLGVGTDVFRSVLTSTS